MFIQAMGVAIAVRGPEVAHLLNDHYLCSQRHVKTEVARRDPLIIH